jgi:hypothetical protein
MNYTLRVSMELHEKLVGIAERERRTIADTTRLLIGVGIASYDRVGRLLDLVVPEPGYGELVLFPVRPSSHADL